MQLPTYQIGKMYSIHHNKNVFIYLMEPRNKIMYLVLPLGTEGRFRCGLALAWKWLNVSAFFLTQC